MTQPNDQLPASDLLDRIESYYDAVPRNAARVEDFGPLLLFVKQGPGYPYYARPTPGWTGPPVQRADVDRVRARQRELGVPESFEWVAETAPGLRAAIEASGLAVHEHPLLVHDGSAAPEQDVAQVLGADAAELASALAVPRTAFAELGTAIGAAGPAELAEHTRACLADGTAARLAERIEAGLTVVAAALVDGAAHCSGQHQPVGEVSEIVAVGTLPSARRQGLAAAVTTALLADAHARGVRTVFLSATDEAVARLYGSLGFRTTATALIAESTVS
ncbi:GNAT family N-acetyltransferase [Kitasatospora sp. McL0602]|uniref:GNAT family N-acetyltransferase n=1 Tax=Kitasatospora sp. McL0602 TaxID=3439530 RepID=UPI003F8ACEFE